MFEKIGSILRDIFIYVIPGMLLIGIVSLMKGVELDKVDIKSGQYFVWILIIF